MEENNGTKFLEKMKKAEKENKEEQKRVLETIKNDKAIYRYVMSIILMLVLSMICLLMLSVEFCFINQIEARLEIGIVGIIVSVIFIILYCVELRKLTK